MLDADAPYLHKFEDGEILAIPATIDFNDLPHAMRFGRPAAARAFEDIVKRCAQENDLWLTTRGQICDYVRPMLPI